MFGERLKYVLELFAGREEPAEALQVMKPRQNIGPQPN